MPTPEVFLMHPSTVRQPLLRGRQLVAGLWFPSDWFDEAERARRLLAQWQAGAQAFRFAEGDLLRFASPIERDCEGLPGWPLRLHARVLSTAAVTDAEGATLPAADVWIVLGGQVLALRWQDAQAIDPSQWLAVGSIALHDTWDCREALPEATELAPVALRDLREVLQGRVPAASEAQKEFLRAMQEEQRKATPGRTAHARRGISMPSFGWLRGPARFLFTVLGVVGLVAMVLHDSGTGANPLAFIGAMYLLYLVLRFLGAGTSWRSGGAEAAGHQPVQGGAAPPLHRRRDAEIKPQAWRQWLARLAITSQVSRLLGRRQAAYVRKMLELFESGKLDEALRHAIPLGGENQGSLGQAFGTPSARNDLSLTPGVRPASSIHLGADLDGYLRQLYRRSFEKLDREGRIDEAVFVLAELLQSRQEALDYLEKHKRFEQAAELALAWDQPAEVIVRLHCLAGDWRRAVAVARRDNAFANAVLQLEKKWPDAAARLREEWARALAARGDWLGAVDAIWPVEGQRAIAVDWLLSAEAAGGQLGARALVQRAVLLPDTLTQHAERLEALRDEDDAAAERAAVAEALMALKDVPQRAAQLARLVAPGVLADQAAGRTRLARGDLLRLMTMSNDPWLRADLPDALPAPRPRQELAELPQPIAGQLPEAGLHAIRDAVTLDDGRYLVALGEAGALVVDAHGKTLARFAVPTHKLVIAHSRQVALALAPRERLWRVSRLDLANRRVADLGVGDFQHMATEFDGVAWTVADGSRLRVLDTQHSLQEVLWQVTDLPGTVVDLTVNAQVEQIALRTERGDVELWRYALPQRRLFVRGEALPERVSEGSLLLLNPNGGVIEAWKDEDAQAGSGVGFRLHGQTRLIKGIAPACAQVREMSALVGGGWLMACLGDDAQARWSAVSLARGQRHAGIEWPARDQPRARIVGGHCLVFDERGRLWDVDTTTSAVCSIALR